VRYTCKFWIPTIAFDPPVPPGLDLGVEPGRTFLIFFRSRKISVIQCCIIT
jgi:hypothetical protein